MKPFFDLKKRVHQLLSERLRPGDVAVDATCGWGRDTEVLARLCAPGGRVYGIDLQEEAVSETRRRLAGISCQPILLVGDHAELDRLLLPEDRGRVAALVFNLGFLPGSDRRVRTRRESTLVAFRKGLGLLRPGGLLLAVIYTGHREGQEELEAILDWLPEAARRGARFHLEIPHGERAPWLLVMERAAFR